MAGISMKILGIQELIKNLEEAGERGILAVGSGLYLEGNNIISDSMKQVPVDLGALKNSRYVTLPNISGKNVTVEIGFGGTAKDYAEIIHERTDFKHPGGGNAKYLQNPLNKAKSGFAKNVTHFAARAFQQNKGASKASGMPEKPK
jgi:hypothetical protein